MNTVLQNFKYFYLLCGRESGLLDVSSSSEENEDEDELDDDELKDEDEW